MLLDYGLSAHISKEVLDYFNPFVITAVFRVYAEELSEAREHPLTKKTLHVETNLLIKNLLKKR